MTVNSPDPTGDDRLPDPSPPSRAERLHLVRKYQHQAAAEDNPLVANLAVLLGDLFACAHVVGESAQTSVSQTGEAAVAIEPRGETLRKYLRDVTRTETCIQRVKRIEGN